MCLPSLAFVVRKSYSKVRKAEFTWDNNNDDLANVQGRIDRAIANPQWLEWFDDFSVTHILS